MSMNKTSSNRERVTAQRGFTILLAALVASIVLALGTSIFSLAQKGLSLSSIGRESQFAFYAADSAAECALYQEIRNAHFSTSTPPADVTCDGQSVPVSMQDLSPQFIFTYEYEPNARCAVVTVTKQEVNPRMRIHADGYNTTCENVETSPHALERSVELRY